MSTGLATMTVEELDAMPEDGMDRELREGNLLEKPGTPMAKMRS